VGAADRNRNGQFEPEVDPVALYLAAPDGLFRLIALGDPLDGGILLAVPSFRLNERGDVAIQALVDRNGNGRFDPGIDTAGLYVIRNGRAAAVVHDGDRSGRGQIVGLETASPPLNWQFNDRDEIAVRAFVRTGEDILHRDEALVLVDASGRPSLLRTGVRTPLGTFSRLAGFGLNNRGDVVFPADLTPEGNRPPALFRVRLSSRAGPVTQLSPPLLAGPDGALIGDLIGANAQQIAVTDSGAVGFCGVYDDLSPDVEGRIPTPLACFVLTPQFLYEVVREGTRSPWGTVQSLGRLELNDREQAALETQIEVSSENGLFGYDVGTALMFWENGIRVGIVGPGDLIPGGRVGSDPRLVGLSDGGLLLFDARVTDDLGISRHGLFAVDVSSGQT
jgi:hypothetical protein